jgi:hypothetical protein
VHRRRKALLIVVSATTMLALGMPARAGHTTDPRTPNLVPRGHIEEPAVTGGLGGADPRIQTDIAFWGDLAFQGNWDGFRIRDISDPNNPTTVSNTSCNGNQGDIVVWDDILVRSWNTPAGTPGAFGAGLDCDGVAVPAGWEGVHIFDVSNLADPQVIGAVELECGSHTATLVPDLDRNRLIVYSNVSSGCNWMDVIEVPLDNPGASSLVNTVPMRGGTLGSNNGCHDVGVILGNENLAVCASGHAAQVLDIGRNEHPGGSLVKPAFLYEIEEVDASGNRVGVGGRWHSAAFTWDGEVIIMGWEPGGGLQAECEREDPAIKKSFFFYDTDTGQKLGQWTLPRAQGPNENCTLHNYNLMPLENGRDILVSGNYQAGTWVTDITDPSRPRTLAWSDPPPEDTPPGSPFCAPATRCALAGAWSTYWYNDHFLYESNIEEGLNIFEFEPNRPLRPIHLDHLNPQTQEFTIG